MQKALAAILAFGVELAVLWACWTWGFHLPVSLPMRSAIGLCLVVAVAAIWGAFALTLRHSFRFLHGRPWLAALMGAIGAPLAYLGAGRFGYAVQFTRGEPAALVALALGWAIALPAMLAFAAAMERSRPSDIRRSAAHVD